jgi:hypothetical protein
MENKIFYKLRFIPTGSFYKPATGYSWEKNNLSPTGKVYSRKAINFSTVSRIHILHDALPERKNVSHNAHPRAKVIETLPSEWEWVEFEVKEKTTTAISNGS